MTTQGEIFVPLNLANELAEVRAELAEVKKLLRPIAQDAEWHTVEGMAKRLGVTRSTINRKIASGELEAKGAGSSRRVKVRS